MAFLSNQELSLKDIWPIMQEVLESGGEFTFKPHGISMLPLIRQGVDDVVLVKVVDSLKVGDAVFYQRDNGQFVLHRIVKIKNGEYVMCGDNQAVLEYGITDRHILAKMKGVIRDGIFVDESNKKYQKYVKGLAFRRFKKRLRGFLGRIKNKIFKKKTV